MREDLARSSSRFLYVYDDRATFSWRFLIEHLLEVLVRSCGDLLKPCESSLHEVLVKKFCQHMLSSALFGDNFRCKCGRRRLTSRSKCSQPSYEIQEHLSGIAVVPSQDNLR